MMLKVLEAIIESISRNNDVLLIPLEWTIEIQRCAQQYWSVYRLAK